jgi:uncharacterized protein (TIGR03067 family)
VEHTDLEGTWLEVEINSCGERARPLVPETLMLRQGTFVADDGSGGLTHGTFRIDPTHNPRRLDWEGSRQIYEVGGDTLRISYRLDRGGEYPQGFAGGPREVVIVYKRVR